MRRVSAPSHRIAVIGAGATVLVGALLDAGYARITAVDISDTALAALARSLARSLGHRSELVEFVRADVCSLSFPEVVDVWHDRATFHFLTDRCDQEAYADRAAAAVRPGGHLVLAAFAIGGPEQCSGLPVCQHSANSLDRVFGASFERVETFDATHITPWGSDQAFIHAVYRRRAGGVSRDG